jgi:hypothetical protein
LEIQNLGIKITRVVASLNKFSGETHYSLVIDRSPVFLFERFGSFLVAEDCGFFNSYQFCNDQYEKAFGGSKFDIRLKNGETIKADGQWWASIPREEVWPGVDTTCLGIATIEELSRCYVFFAGRIWTPLLEEALKMPTIGYWDLDKEIRSTKEV